MTTEPTGGTPAADPAQPGQTIVNSGASQSTPIPNAPAAPAPAQKPAAAEIYKPDGLGDHLVGATNQETIDRLLKENTGFRQAQATRPQAFAKPEDVTFEWGDKVKELGGIAQDDKALGLFKTLAVEHEFSAKQIAAIPKFFELAAGQGLIDQPYNPAKVLEGLAPADFRGSPQDKQLRGGERLRTAENWLNQLPATAGFDDGVKNELKLLTTSVDGVRALEAMMKAGMNPSVSAGGAGNASQTVSKADLDARVADPRYWADNPKYDKAFAEETAALYKKFYGNS